MAIVFSPQLILQFTKGVQWFYKRKLSFSKDPEGVKHFPGGPTFSRGGGVQMLISIETHITCDFPGPPPPLSRSVHENIRWNVCLFDLILYFPSTIFQL